MKLESRVADIIAIGTDGETAIVQALKATLHGNTIYLRCFLHMKENIKRKLTEFLIPEHISQEIIKDLFGIQQGTDYIKGAVDLLTTTEFDIHLQELKIKWDQLEYSVHPDQQPLFYEWFVKNELDVMKTSMIASVRESAGLGSPPVPYTTNRNESMNKVAKSYADHQKVNWVQLTDNMFDLINIQLKEIEKAIIGMGEYRFKPAYGNLEVASNKWFLMSSQQREKHMKKVFDKPCILIEASLPSSMDPAPGCSEAPSIRELSISPEGSGISNISPEQLERTWKKANKLLNLPGSICKAPGMCDAMCVASETGSRPHIVSKTKKGV